MNNLTKLEAEYLRIMNPYLKDGNMQIIINALRQYITTEKANRGFDADRGGYRGDMNWTDKDLM